MNQHNISPLYKIIKALVRFFYPRTQVEGAEHLPEEPAVIVGNHAKMNGPIICELYFPRRHRTWCAGEMMHLEQVPNYAFQDFWSEKPRYIRWFYRLLSYLIAPLSVCVFNNADTIGVYRDNRVLSTFRNSVKALQNGKDIVIFPEHNVPHNHIVNDFQDRFIDLARLYHRRTGRELCFVPMYIAPTLKRAFLGTPIRFRADAPIEEERSRICTCLMESITSMACALPEHVVVPYQNIPRRKCWTNLSGKDGAHDQA